jgi:hypothetical protein
LSGSSFASLTSFLPGLRACRAISPVFHDRRPAQTAGQLAFDRLTVFGQAIGMMGALFLWRLQGINEKESVMSTLTLIHRSLSHELAGNTSRRVAADSRQSKSRGAIHFEDVVATISLAALSTTVLTLVYQSIVP